MKKTILTMLLAIVALTVQAIDAKQLLEESSPALP